MEESKMKSIRRFTGLSQAKFGKKYNIPKRTIENWEEGKNDAPAYVLELLGRCVWSDEFREWHDVQDKKPDAMVDVIICDADRDMYIGHYSEVDNEWLSDDAGKVDNVTAWMYLPEAYRREE